MTADPLVALERIKTLVNELQAENDAYGLTHNPECQCEWIPATDYLLDKFRETLAATEEKR
jgi:hypothetical protein